MRESYVVEGKLCFGLMSGGSRQYYAITCISESTSRPHAGGHAS